MNDLEEVSIGIIQEEICSIKKIYCKKYVRGMFKKKGIFVPCI